MDSEHPTGVRYVVEVGPGDSGVRISLRRKLPEGGYADVFGVLLSWADDLVRVERRDGSVAQIPARDVVAAKRIPPPPVRRAR